MESQPQNPEFRINPENSHPWIFTFSFDLALPLSGFLSSSVIPLQHTST